VIGEVESGTGTGIGAKAIPESIRDRSDLALPNVTGNDLADGGGGAGGVHPLSTGRALPQTLGEVAPHFWQNFHPGLIGAPQEQVAG
jgi:hypothetical protein